MSDHTPENMDAALNRLWKHLDDERVGLLAVKGADQHPQPMTMFADRDARAVWFITSADTDLVGAVGAGADAGLTLQADDNAYIVSLDGRLDLSQDTEKLDELWNFAAAAWFDEGREDPKVRLLRFTPAEASVWSSDSNPLLVGLKMMSAAMVKGTSDPDVGSHEVIRLTMAA